MTAPELLLLSTSRIITGDAVSLVALLLSGVIPILANSIGKYIKAIRPRSEKITISTTHSGESVVFNLSNPSKEEQTDAEKHLKELLEKEKGE